MKNLKVIKVDSTGIEFENGIRLYSEHKSDCCESHVIKHLNKMKAALLIIIICMITSCGPRIGTHPENDPIRIPKIDTCVVETISLSNGKYQYFIVHVKNKRKAYDISTKKINFNIDDTVVVIDSKTIIKKK